MILINSMAPMLSWIILSPYLSLLTCVAFPDFSHLFFFHIETLICLWCFTLFHSTLGFSKPFVVYGMHCVAVRCYV